CICSQCIKSEHTDASGNQVEGLWINCGTRRHHMKRMCAEPQDLSTLKELSEDFCTKACIKDADLAFHVLLEADDMSSTIS
ncbi:hypothetical protein CROQUDRAFT_10461, partial [Cronartium quercuum f. sp. fusiforme G11]